MTTLNEITYVDWQYKLNKIGSVAEGVEAVYPLPGTLSVEYKDKGAFYYNYRGFYWTTALTDKAAIGFLYSSTVFHTSKLGSRTCVRPAAANIRCMKIE